MQTVKVKITPEGVASMVYKDNHPLLKDRLINVVRMTHIQFDPFHQKWFVYRDKSKLLKIPFSTYKEAVDAEVSFFNEHPEFL